MNKVSKQTERFIVVLFLIAVIALCLFILGVFHLPAKPSPVKYGYINRNGKAVINFEYDSAGDFHRGLATVRKGSRVFVINTSGEEVSDETFRFDADSSDCRHIIPVVNKEQFNELNKPYELIAKNATGFALFRIQRRHVQDADGKAAFDFVYTFIPMGRVDGHPRIYEEAHPFCDSLALVKGEYNRPARSDWEAHSYGFINTDGQYAIRPVYHVARNFSEGLAAVGILTNYHHSH
jgi:hypothetical protein